jgi:hypothetical protein
MSRFELILIVLGITAVVSGLCALVAWYLARMGRRKDEI